MTRATLPTDDSPRVAPEAVIVLGAGGGVGRGITHALLDAGHTVVAIGRNTERLSALARDNASDRRLKLLPGSVASDAEAAELVGAINALNVRPIAVVASLGGELQSARLLEKPATFLQRTFDENVLPHFIAAKHLLPVLAESRPGGAYLFITPPTGQCAWAGYGHRSVSAAALRMLTLVLREEAKDMHLRVQQLQLGTPVRTDFNVSRACPDWLSAADVGQRVSELIERSSSNHPVVELGGYAKRRAPGEAISF